MTDIKLVSQGKRQLKPLVEAALANQLRLLLAGIRQTEERLQKFENKFQMNTQDFISRYENDEIEETLSKRTLMQNVPQRSMLLISRGKQSARWVVWFSWSGRAIQ